MVKTEKLNLQDVIMGLIKMFESENTSKDEKLEKQIANAERLADKIAENVYKKTAEAQLDAETSRIKTSRDLKINNKRNITREKSTGQVKPKEVDHDGEITL